jgi:hypothetical protein
MLREINTIAARQCIVLAEKLNTARYDITRAFILGI